MNGFVLYININCWFVEKRLLIWMRMNVRLTLNLFALMARIFNCAMSDSIFDSSLMCLLAILGESAGRCFVGKDVVLIFITIQSHSNRMIGATFWLASPMFSFSFSLWTGFCSCVVPAGLLEGTKLRVTITLIEVVQAWQKECVSLPPRMSVHQLATPFNNDDRCRKPFWSREW